MNTAHCILKSFEPLIDNQVQFLIVGTMPGEKSLSEGEYYAHPRNAMWPIISKLFNQEKAFTSYSQQKACLLANHIGMWDNLQYCQRCGSLDSDISNEVPNDFETLCKQYPSIKRFLFNGQKSYFFFKKYHFQLLNKYEYFILPSTSPANASKNFNQKLSEWKKALT